MNNFWEKLNKPFTVLAPMAGYTDSAFRLLCRRLGAEVVVSELISADAIAHGKFEVSQREVLDERGQKLTLNEVTAKKNHTTAEMLSFFEEERPFVIQLFGKNPENFALAAKWVSENLKPNGIDINMGCPARKVVGSDHGAALLKNPDLASEIILAVKSATSLPVSVKTRLGWDNDDQILEFAPELAQAGISSLMIHGRTYKDAFKGKARWENIYKIKEMFRDKLVVIGNGDLQGAQPCKGQETRLRQGYGGQAGDPTPLSELHRASKRQDLDGVAIGRGSFGKPWIFSERQETSDKRQENLEEIILAHAKLSEISKGEKGILEFRKHLLMYLRDFPEAKKLRLEAVKIESYQDVEKIVALIKDKKNLAIDKTISS